MRVSIQGVRGAFHEIAARLYFDQEITIVPGLTFEATIGHLFPTEQGNPTADIAVMAIENTIAGTILGNYKLLQTNPVQITGEIFIPIRQNLLALEGVTLNALTEVHSHPMALAQCQNFLGQHPQIRLVESEDTAVSAAYIAQHQLRYMAAIGSTLAAEVYGLKVLVPDIETHHENFTRFLVVERTDNLLTNMPHDAAFHKISVSFVVPHTRGSLAAILHYLAQKDANLTKIQSVPLVGRPWEYLFFLDFTVDTQADHQAILHQIEALTTEFKILGRYAASVSSNILF